MQILVKRFRPVYTHSSTLRYYKDTSWLQKNFTHMHVYQHLYNTESSSHASTHPFKQIPVSISVIILSHSAKQSRHLCSGECLSCTVVDDRMWKVRQKGGSTPSPLHQNLLEMRQHPNPHPPGTDQTFHKFTFQRKKINFFFFLIK